MRKIFGGRHQKSFRLGIAATALVVLAVVFGVLALASGTNEPSAEEKQDMNAKIDAWLTFYDVEWPKGYASIADLPTAFTDARYASDMQILKSIGTQGFIEDQKPHNMSNYMREGKAGGQILIKSEHSVLSSEFMSPGLDSGQLQVKATIWSGSTFAPWDSKAGKLGAEYKVDCIIVRMVTFVKENGVWKIDHAESVAAYGDESASEYGPDTPHSTVSEY